MMVDDVTIAAADIILVICMRKQRFLYINKLNSFIIMLMTTRLLWTSVYGVVNARARAFPVKPANVRMYRIIW